MLPASGHIIKAPAKRKYKALLQELQVLENKMKLNVTEQQSIIHGVHSTQKISAENLVNYLTLRTIDVQQLQDQLHLAGLSSLASSESHILAQVQAIQQVLGRDYQKEELSSCTFKKGHHKIESCSKRLFGQKAEASIPYIMVTFDTGFADDVKLIQSLLHAGMNIARINCAHDNKAAWEKMIRNLRIASNLTGIPCKVYMDMAGPKMRTTILGKGKRQKRVSLSPGQIFMLSEKKKHMDISQVIIGCSEPGIIHQLKPGERVLFDDGLIEATVTEITDEGIKLQTTRVSSKKSRLKAGKGINFPESNLELPELTGFDRSTMPFICKHADLVGYSFVRNTGDVQLLQQMLAAYRKRPKIILKIETPQAVKHFPALLLQGMKDQYFGVMIARGDLAVEIGFERMSEIQEEITWICEAAHVPVIWATQVLETLNKSGLATRSEITDASHASVAECVMINKGEHILKVIKSLKDILKRSGTHHIKKRFTLRPMKIAINYFNAT